MAALFEDKKGGGNGLLFFSLSFPMFQFGIFSFFSLLYFCGVDTMPPLHPVIL